MGNQLPSPKKGAEPPVFGPFLLSPNDWMNQDGTWHGGGAWSKPHCARWGPSSPPQKRGQPPIFGPFLLSPDGWMHQHATWYGCRPQPRRLCVRWGPGFHSPKGAQSPQFSANIRCGQTTGWPKMALGMEVGLGPGDCVRSGPSYPQGHSSPPHLFAPCLFWPRSPISATAELLLNHCRKSYTGLPRASRQLFVVEVGDSPTDVDGEGNPAVVERVSALPGVHIRL